MNVLAKVLATAVLGLAIAASPSVADARTHGSAGTTTKAAGGKLAGTKSASKKKAGKTAGTRKTGKKAGKKKGAKKGQTKGHKKGQKTIGAPAKHAK